MMKKSDPLISLENAGLKRSGRWLIRGIDLVVHRGEIVTLIGPNGSGKTTTAKLALGVFKPDEGRVAQSKNLCVGYVPQKLSIDWTLPMTVQRFMSLTGSVGQNDLRQALEATGVSHLAKAEVRNLSGGEFQRVLLARALARKPDILVLDEPIQGVDYAGEIEIYDLIKQIRNKLNCGILLISHDLHMVMAETDRVVCLNGHVCCAGSPKEVALSPEYQALFGDKAAPALAVYEHHHDHTHMPDGRVMHADGSITDHCHPGDGHHDHDAKSDKMEKRSHV